MVGESFLVAMMPLLYEIHASCHFLPALRENKGVAVQKRRLKYKDDARRALRKFGRPGLWKYAISWIDPSVKVYFHICIFNMFNIMCEYSQI